MTPQYNFFCMLCGSATYHIRKGHARDNTALIPLECTECGLVTLSSHTHIDNNFYAESHMHDSTPCDPVLELQQGAEDTVRRYEQWHQLLAGKHVLDIGCGAGGFLLKAREIAASVTGIEPERRLFTHFSANNLQVYPSLSDLPPCKSFDVVTMFHVLEHIRVPLEMLKQLHTKVREKLIIEVPSANDALLTLYDTTAFSKFTYWSCHLYLYTPDNLKVLGEQAGFHTQQIFQFQRYPLANHLYWLSEGKPGGQHVWKGLFSPALENNYASDLAKQGRCDTVIGVFTSNNSDTSNV